MSEHIADARVSNGHLELFNLPFPDETEVKVIVVPKRIEAENRLKKIRVLTSKLKGNLSDVVVAERDER